MLVLVIAASSILFAAEVSAAPAKSVAEAPAAVTPVTGLTVKSEDDKRMVCKTAPPTGTRLPGKRTCMTRGEWESRAAESKKDLMERQAKTQGPRSS